MTEYQKSILNYSTSVRIACYTYDKSRTVSHCLFYICQRKQQPGKMIWKWREFIFYSRKECQSYSTDFTKWDRFFISGWPALTLASPSLARAQARRDRRRIGCAQRMKWAQAPTRFGPGNYTRPNSTWACTQYTVWRLAWMLWTMCHLAGLARLALGKTGRAQLDHIQHHLNSSELI